MLSASAVAAAAATELKTRRLCLAAILRALSVWFFFFNDTATTEIYTLSLHDALPIYRRLHRPPPCRRSTCGRARRPGDRKSTRLNSSHLVISYAVFCLKKKIHRDWPRRSHKTRQAQKSEEITCRL